MLVAPRSSGVGIGIQPLVELALMRMEFMIARSLARSSWAVCGRPCTVMEVSSTRSQLSASPEK